MSWLSINFLLQNYADQIESYTRENIAFLIFKWYFEPTAVNISCIYKI